jgi:hypothetical protein
MSTKYAPIKRIDQIYCQVVSVGDVNKLYYLFSNTLGLPEAWPPTDKKSYYGGGVYTGNTWLKWTSPNTRAYVMTDHPARFRSLSLLPTDYDKSLKTLENRGIETEYDGAATVPDETGEEKEWARSSSLTQKPYKDYNLFICRYTPVAFPALTTTPEAEDLDQHYKIMRSRLDSLDGGCLGVRYVKEVELGAEKLRDCTRRWQAILDPVKPVSEACWRIGNGPMVRLTGDSVNRIRSLTFRVRSIRRARMVLKGLGLLGEVKGDTLTICPDKVNGLEFKLTK